MSALSSFISGGGGKLRYEEFTSSGTFTPSSKLLANGGQCFVTLIGGGGGGGYGRATGPVIGDGGNAGQYIESVVTVTGATTVTIGAGGTGGNGSTSLPAASGGNSTFGSLLTALGGLYGNASNVSYVKGGNGAAGPGYHVTDTTNVLDARGGVGINGKAGGGGGGAAIGGHNFAVDGGGNGGTGASATGVSASNNTGAGGGGANAGNANGGDGGSGWCRVVWFE